MKKCYKYATIKGMKKLFNEYDRDHFTNAAYKFMINFMRVRGIKQFDVIQLCEMFCECTFIELFGELETSLKRTSQLRKELKIKRNNFNFSLIDYDNNTYITWYDESLREMIELSNY